ncbi:MAG: hypothetical protein Q9169_004596 [Polycauliona sp. 2 TL-2023]
MQLLAFLLCAASLSSAIPAGISSPHVNLQVSLHDEKPNDSDVKLLTNFPDRFTLIAVTKDHFSLPLTLGVDRDFPILITDVVESIFSLQGDKLGFHHFNAYGPTDRFIGERPFSRRLEGGYLGVGKETELGFVYKMKAVEKADGFYLELVGECEFVALYLHASTSTILEWSKDSADRTHLAWRYGNAFMILKHDYQPINQPVRLFNWVSAGHVAELKVIPYPRPAASELAPFESIPDVPLHRTAAAEIGPPKSLPDIQEHTTACFKIDPLEDPPDLFSLQAAMHRSPLRYVSFYDTAKEGLPLLIGVASLFTLQQGKLKVSASSDLALGVLPGTANPPFVGLVHSSVAFDMEFREGEDELHRSIGLSRETEQRYGSLLHLDGEDEVRIKPRTCLVYGKDSQPFQMEAVSKDGGMYIQLTEDSKFPTLYCGQAKHFTLDQAEGVYPSLTEITK